MKKMTKNLVSLSVATALAGVSLISLVHSFAKAQADKETPEVAATETAAPAEEESTDTQEVDQAAAEREATISAWAERIDAFNAGYPLEGHGWAFAEAAYDSGVDPRYAPAIARVESGSGLNCAYSCNAWGWGSASWSDWDTAIYEYTAALGAAYGYTLTYDAALSYNEVTPDAWYAEVESCMYQIAESGSL